MKQRTNLFLRKSLNSNLILLILREKAENVNREAALNSNLILLIRRSERSTGQRITSFKFQSDSINTLVLVAQLKSEFNFKFQSDSINTTWDSGQEIPLYYL